MANDAPNVFDQIHTEAQQSGPNGSDQIHSEQQAGNSSKPGVLSKAWDRANEYAGKALSAAGLPQSISDIPDWARHLVGMAPDSKPFWDPIHEAAKNPTQENLVN